MGPKTKLLIAELEELIDLLESDNEKHWQEWMRSARDSLLKSDFTGVEKILSSYGGMGSFNDLILGTYASFGVIKNSKHHVMLNEQLVLHREKVRELALEIKYDHQTIT